MNKRKITFCLSTEQAEADIAKTLVKRDNPYFSEIVDLYIKATEFSTNITDESQKTNIDAMYSIGFIIKSVTECKDENDE